MALLDTVPITSCHECVAMLTLPLALFLLLAETAVGGFATVAYLRLTGGLTHGFLKFIAVTYAIFGALAFVVVLAGPPGSYHRLLSINEPAADALLSVLLALGAVVLPLVAAGLALPTCRLRSFMSTTGLLYLAMIAILPGQLLGLLLFFVAASA